MENWGRILKDVIVLREQVREGEGNSIIKEAFQKKHR